MSPMPGLVHLVDDDPSIRRGMDRLLKVHGYEVRTYPDAAAFLEAPDGPGPACLLLDLRLPGLDGLGLQSRLAVRSQDLPIVFLTAHGDVPTAVQAMKAGALDFLPKPFEEASLLRALDAALDRSRLLQLERSEREHLSRTFQTLTPREREVLQGVLAGRLNKQIAFDLGIAEKTVKIHRGHALRKLGNPSLPTLARMASLGDFRVPPGE